MYQDLAWYITVVLVVAVLLLFVHVARSTRTREDYAAVGRNRRASGLRHSSS